MVLSFFLEAAMLIFLFASVLFIFIKPKYMGKIDAIFICWIFIIYYTFLSAGYDNKWSLFCTFLGIISTTFLWLAIYFLLKKITKTFKMPVIAVCLIAWVFYGVIFSDMTKIESTNVSSKSQGYVGVLMDGALKLIGK